MVHTSEVANTKQTENPLAQANYTSTQSSYLRYQVIFVELLSITQVIVDKQKFLLPV